MAGDFQRATREGKEVEQALEKVFAVGSELDRGGDARFGPVGPLERVLEYPEGFARRPPEGRPPGEAPLRPKPASS